MGCQGCVCTDSQNCTCRSSRQPVITIPSSSVSQSFANFQSDPLHHNSYSIYQLSLPPHNVHSYEPYDPHVPYASHDQHCTYPPNPSYSNFSLQINSHSVPSSSTAYSPIPYNQFYNHRNPLQSSHIPNIHSQSSSQPTSSWSSSSNKPPPPAARSSAASHKRHHTVAPVNSSPVSATTSVGPITAEPPSTTGSPSNPVINGYCSLSHNWWNVNSISAMDVYFFCQAADSSEEPTDHIPENNPILKTKPKSNYISCKLCW